MSVSIELNNIQFVGTWKYNCKNLECVCKRPLYMPTVEEIEKKNINTNNVIIGECGHAIHQSCIESYIKTYGNMCPFDKLQWNPMKGDVPTYYVVENQ
jgi:hypothetical protein